MNKIKILFSIIERGKGKEYIEKLSQQRISFHIQSIGHGTAPSGMRDIFGLVNNEKDIVISFASEQATAAFINAQGRVDAKKTYYGGLAMVCGLSAINRIAAEIFTYKDLDTYKGDLTMENESKYNLILIAVNQGYSEEVMKVAKKAGATGGTIIRGRLAGTERLEQFDDIQVEEEREIISILAPLSSCKEIMDSVNIEFGISSKAKGIICALPVEKAFKI